MRVFVAAELPPEVSRAVEGLPRPLSDRVRWTTRAQWHITVAFLGEIDPGKVASVAASVQGAGPVGAEVRLGPGTRVLNRSVLCLPVAGLEEVAGQVGVSLLAAGFAIENRSYRGHLTVARARGRRTVPRAMAGVALEASWRVEELAVISSVLEAEGARYEVLERVHLAGGS